MEEKQELIKRMAYGMPYYVPKHLSNHGKSILRETQAAIVKAKMPKNCYK